MRVLHPGLVVGKYLVNVVLAFLLAGGLEVLGLAGRIQLQVELLELAALEGFDLGQLLL